MSQNVVKYTLIFLKEAVLLMQSKLIHGILNLKKEKNAVILAHYYAPGEVQEIADYVGDSFYLAKAAKSTDADIIVFCGVSFMGESAKILNPEKKVLMPDITADCAMAHMASREKILEMREKYTDLSVVCYINSTAELKCLSDVCVTSSNAVRIVRALPEKNIFFIPDGNLGRHVKEQVPDKNIILNDGFCPVHVGITADMIRAEKKNHPSALVLSHPECKEDVLALSDFAGSTADIIKYATESECGEFIVCTECGVLHELKRRNPEKSFYFGSECPFCRDMKLNTLRSVLDCLKNETNEVKVSDEIREGALKPLLRMLELGR